MANDGDLDRIWSVIEQVGVCMLTTLDPRITRATSGAAAGPNRRIDLVRHRFTRRQREIATNRKVCLICIDKDENAYLSITDPAVAAAIWKTSDNMWSDEPDDPNPDSCELHFEGRIPELSPISARIARRQ